MDCVSPCFCCAVALTWGRCYPLYIFGKFEFSFVKINSNNKLTSRAKGVLIVCIPSLCKVIQIRKEINKYIYMYTHTHTKQYIYIYKASINI